MKQTINLPVFMNIEHRIILFDGVCKLCNAWSRFIIRFDKNKIFKLASVQSDKGRAILKHYNLPLNYYETMLYIENGVAYKKSTAFLKIVRQLPYPFRFLAFTKFLPLSMRDWLYDRIALNRYVLFGKYDQCLMPEADHEKRFL